VALPLAGWLVPPSSGAPSLQISPRADKNMFKTRRRTNARLRVLAHELPNPEDLEVASDRSARTAPVLSEDAEAVGPVATRRSWLANSTGSSAFPTGGAVTWQPATGQRLGFKKERQPATGQRLGFKKGRQPATGQRLGFKKGRPPASGQRRGLKKKRLSASGQRRGLKKKRPPATGQPLKWKPMRLPVTRQRLRSKPMRLPVARQHGCSNNGSLRILESVR